MCVPRVWIWLASMLAVGPKLSRLQGRRAWRLDGLVGRVVARSITAPDHWLGRPQRQTVTGRILLKRRSELLDRRLGPLLRRALGASRRDPHGDGCEEAHERGQRPADDTLVGFRPAHLGQYLATSSFSIP